MQCLELAPFIPPTLGNKMKMCINDSSGQALITCSTLWKSGPVLPSQAQSTWDLHVCVKGQLACQFSVWRCRAALSVVLVQRYFSGQTRSSVSRELIIGRHTAHSLHRGCKGAQAAKSSPYCAYSPHLRSLCCAVHSGPPVQLFLYKKLQNSILRRERQGQRMGGRGERRQKQH